MSEFFPSFNISASGLTAQRLRMDTIANNIANVNTTRTPTGRPYRRQEVVFQQRLRELIFKPPFVQEDIAIGEGVRVVGIIEDNSPPQLVYNPGHPDANEHGYVAMPNVNIVKEMVDMISASRAYEANLMAINAFKSMVLRALEIGRT